MIVQGELRQEAQAFHGVLHRRVLRQVLDGLDDLLLQTC